MSNRFKKISLSLYLDPKHSSSDRVAYTTLADWAKKRQRYAADPSAAVDLHNLVHVHKDIYLSGLFLHLLKPELATSLASSLSNDAIKDQVLIDVMNSHQINASQSGSAVDQSQLLEAISLQVQSALTSGLAEQRQSSQGEVDVATSELKAQLSSELAEQVQSSCHEIESATNELKAQIERIEAERIRQLEQQKVPVTDHSHDMHAELAEILNGQIKDALQSHLSELQSGSASPVELDTDLLTEKLASIIRQRDDEQKRQLDQLTDLIRKQSQLLKKLSLNQPITSADDNNSDSVDLSSPEQVEKRLANVQKMKKKRVF